MAGSDRDELLRFIAAQRADYVQGLPDKLARMRVSWEAGDAGSLKAMQRVAHSIHGTAGTYGLAAIGEAGEALETAIEALEGAGPGSPARRQAVEDALAALSRRLAELSPPAPP